MIEFIKKLLCRHIFIECCKIDDFSKRKVSYKLTCPSRTKYGHCKRHNENGELLGGYCDYYFQYCINCGKYKSRYEVENE